jgi:metal-responsive CopG/Arc/MetJ family transcriptional regulator
MAKRKRNLEDEQPRLNLQVPDGLLDAMDGIIKKKKKWINRQDYIRVAIAEKNDRETAEDPI